MKMRYATIFVVLALSLLIVGCSGAPDDAGLPVADQQSPSEPVVNEPGDTLPSVQVTPLDNESSVDDVDQALSDVDLDSW